MKELNWDNIFKILSEYTQQKHYYLLFDKYNLKKRSSRLDMALELQKSVKDTGMLGPVVSESTMEEWLSLHQIDGNNYTFVYNLNEIPDSKRLDYLYTHKNNLVNLRLSNVDVNQLAEDVLGLNNSGLDEIKLIGIHRDELKRKYIFSYVTSCLVNEPNEQADLQYYKKLFFCHCVLFVESKDCKVIFNPTSHLVHVNNVRKRKRHDWSPISNMFFENFKRLIGEKITTTPPEWIPYALYRLAEDATGHNNPIITSLSFGAQPAIEKFANQLLKEANIETEKEMALKNKFIQDIQLSFEMQLIEKYGFKQTEDEISIFKQRSDGVTHIISVESTYEGLKSGAAAEAARRSRKNSDIDLLGVILKHKGHIYKFLVEYYENAYLIRGTNTFVEEEVVNIVCNKLNEYKEQIQNDINETPTYRENITGTEDK